MKKIRLLTAVGILLFSITAKGQNDPKTAVLTMQQETSLTDNILSQISESIKKDKHKEMEVQIHSLESSLARIQDQSASLPKEYNEGLSTKINDLKTTVSEFEKLVHKSSVFDKDKQLNSKLLQLNTKFSSVKSYISYVNGELDKQQVQQQQQQQQQQTQNANDPNIIASINKELSTIKSTLDSMHVYNKKSNYKKIAKFGKDAANSAGKISDMTLLVKGDQKDNIKILANETKIIANKIHVAAKKGKAAHHDLHEHMEELESKLSTLSVAVGTLK